MITVQLACNQPRLLTVNGDTCRTPKLPGEAAQAAVVRSFPSS